MGQQIKISLFATPTDGMWMERSESGPDTEVSTGTSPS